MCQSYSLQDAQEEASRCLDCYIQTVFESEKCILCGGRVDVCPMRCLRLVDIAAMKGNQELEAALRVRYGDTASRIGTAVIKDEEKCIRCGLCEKRCPTGTITMERFSIEPVKEVNHGA